MRTLRYVLALTILCSAIFLSGCTPYTATPPHSPLLSKKAAGGAIAGLTAGFVGDGIAEATTVVGGPIGAVVGYGIGAYLASNSHWLERFEKQGVQLILVGHRVRIILPSDKIFYFGTARIVPQSDPILNSVVAFLHRYGRVPITVSGYTDDVGYSPASLELSKHQAQTVAAYLWTHGVPFKDLHAVGYGKHYPIASNGNPRGKAYNRRVEITLPVVYGHHHHKHHQQNFTVAQK